MYARGVSGDFLETDSQMINLSDSITTVRLIEVRSMHRIITDMRISRVAGPAK